MNSLRNYLNKATALVALAASLVTAGCAGGKGAVSQPVPAGGMRVAVLPVDNLSGGPAPLTEIRHALMERMSQQGLRFVDEEEFQRFVPQHRLRYTGGVDKPLAQALRDELKVDAVLITSLELCNEDTPPKIALTSRLVRLGDIPLITWMDSVGIAGDDAPGILNLGLITDPKVLREKAVGLLARSLARHLAENRREDAVAARYAPKVAFSGATLPEGKRPSIAVVPFFNQSMRRYAGEIEVLHFVKQLVDSRRFDVMEPGVVRDSMLRMRVILNDGISLPHLDLLSIGLDADYVLTGKVFDYQDYDGAMGKPKLDFSVQLVERKEKKIVWASKSYNEGDDGVYFYDWGKVTTASELAEKMTKSVVDRMLKN